MAGTALCELKVDFVAGRALGDPRNADFVDIHSSRTLTSTLTLAEILNPNRVQKDLLQTKPPKKQSSNDRV